MKFIRFLINSKEKNGIVIEEDHTVREIKGDFFDKYEILENQYSLSEIKYLPPCMPSKIIALGLNYFDHAEEFKLKIPEEPLIFLKPSTAVIGHKENIIYPKMTERLDYEAELGVIIKNKVKNIKPKEVYENILGYTCFNDVTARDLQKKDGQWTRSKSFDTFAPLGPYIVTDLEPNNLEIKLRQNGKVKQHSSTSKMIFKIEEMISFISQIMTLNPGDVIVTGTPSGVGELQVGDVVEVEIEGIGTLTNYISL
jgi:2-keto-4-pentenoate hydratase/2-oxohepta-3-ene-1,7-dioic acid hydratase in catechol pathway